MRNGLRASYVNGNSLLFFAEQARPSFQEDVLISTLCSQLAASAKHSAFSEFAAWHRHYVSVLAGLRCLISCSDMQDCPLNPDETIWARVKGLLGKRVPASLIEAAETAITYMGTHGDYDASSLLRKQTVQLDSHSGGVLLPPVTNVMQTISDSDSDIEGCNEVYDVTLQLGFMDAAPRMNLPFCLSKVPARLAHAPLPTCFLPA